MKKKILKVCKDYFPSSRGNPEENVLELREEDKGALIGTIDFPPAGITISPSPFIPFFTTNTQINIRAKIILLEKELRKDFLLSGDLTEFLKDWEGKKVFSIENKF